MIITKLFSTLLVAQCRRRPRCSLEKRCRESKKERTEIMVEVQGP